MAGQPNKMTDPYIAGDPVGGSTAFVGRQSILRDVLRMLQNPNENAIVLYGQRRMGRHRCYRKLARRLSADGPYQPVYFDLQDKAAMPLKSVIQDIAQRVAAQLKLPPPPEWGTSAPEQLRTEFLPKALARLPADHALVLLFDEFDVLDNPKESQAGAAFFPYLPRFDDRRPRLQFVFVIGRRPQNLPRSPSPSLRASVRRTSRFWMPKRPSNWCVSAKPTVHFAGRRKRWRPSAH